MLAVWCNTLQKKKKSHRNKIQQASQYLPDKFSKTAGSLKFGNAVNWHTHTHLQYRWERKISIQLVNILTNVAIQIKKLVLLSSNNMACLIASLKNQFLIGCVHLSGEKNCTRYTENIYCSCNVCVSLNTLVNMCKINQKLNLFVKCIKRCIFKQSLVFKTFFFRLITNIIFLHTASFRQSNTSTLQKFFLRASSQQNTPMFIRISTNSITWLQCTMRVLGVVFG